MANGVTPTLGLTLGPDDLQNDNWRKLDSLIANLAALQVIPGDLLVEGNLHVTGTSTLDGPVTAGSIDATTISTTDLLASGTVQADGRITGRGGLTVESGSVVLPDLSIDGADLMKAASVQGIWVGTPSTGGFAVTATPAALATVNTDASEQTGRWEIVLAQVTLTISLGSSADPPNIVVTAELRRDGTVTQTRVLSYIASQTPGDGFDMDIPLTMVRLTQVTTVPGSWSVWGSCVKNAGALVTASFGQMHCLQLR